MAATVALLKPLAQAMLNTCALSIAKMDHSTDDEAAALAARFDALAGTMTKAVFARRFGLPGGASMLSQHLSGNRPLSLEAAMAYARGFGVPLGDISRRVADQVRAAMELLGDAPPHVESEAGPVAAALPRVLNAIGGLTPGQWAMVRARLDDLPGHPEACEDVTTDILPILVRPTSKRRRVG